MPGGTEVDPITSVRFHEKVEVISAVSQYKTHGAKTCKHLTAQ